MDEIDNKAIKAALVTFIDQIRSLETALRVQQYQIEGYSDEIIKLKRVIRECQDRMGINYSTSADIARLTQENKKLVIENKKLNERILNMENR